MTRAPTEICVLTPVFNDWQSFVELVADLSRTFEGKGVVLDVLASNDGSTIASSAFPLPPINREVVRAVRIADLRTNVGHQMAIAAALYHLGGQTKSYDAVIVMDADGEDRPSDALRLVEAMAAHPGSAIVAERAKRSESAAFKLFYVLYRIIFRVLTGKTIKFGNFMLVPWTELLKLLSRPELPYHAAATLLRSRLAIASILTERGSRYAGRSSMNMPSLVFHAVAALSVFSDILFARLLIMAAITVGLAAIGMVGVIILRLFTALSTPGWATLVAATLGIVTLQILLLVFFMGFLLMTNRALMLSTSSKAGELVEGVRDFAPGKVVGPAVAS